MAVNQATGYNRTTKEPLDALYLNSGSVYTSIAAVNAAVNINVRYTGSKFNVNGEDYWYKDGVQDTDLVVCIDKRSFATTQSFQVFTQSLHTYTQSNDVRVSDTYISQSNYTPSSSFHAYTQSVNTQLSNIYISESNYLPTASFNPISSSFDARVLANSASIYSIVHNSGSLATLTDVVLASLTPGQALVYDTGTSKWKNASFISASISGNAATATNVAASGVTGGYSLGLVDDTNVTISQTNAGVAALLSAKTLTIGWTGTLADARITSATNWNLAYAYSLIGHLPLAGGTVSGNIFMSGGAAIDASLTGGVDVLNIGTSNSDTINIGWSGATVNIQGTVLYSNVTNLQVTDKLITVNKGGAAASGVSAGFEVEEGGSITGYFATDSTRTGWDFKAPASQQLTLGLDLLSTARVIKMPNASGTIALLTSLSSTATGLTYTNTSGVFSLTSGYVIPTTTEQSNWNTAYGWGNWAANSHYIGTTLIANNRASGAQTLAGVSIDGTAAYATNWGGFQADFNVVASSFDYIAVRDIAAGKFKVGSAASVASFLSGQTMNIVGNASTATLAANSTKWAGFDYTGVISTTPLYAMMYNSATSDWRPIGASGLATFLSGQTMNIVGNASTATNVAASGVTSGHALGLVDDTNVTISQTNSGVPALLTAKTLTIGWTGTLADSRITSSSNWNTAYSWGNHAGLYLLLTGGTVSGRTLFVKSAQTSYSTAALEVYTADGAASKVGISFHRGGQSAGFLSHGPLGGLYWEDDKLLMASMSSVTPTASSLVLRDGSGYVEAVYFKSTNTYTQSGNLGKITGKLNTGDQYLYEFTAAAVKDFLSLPSGGETLATVTGRGNSTSTATYFNNGAYASNFGVGEMSFTSNQIYRASANEMYVNYSGTGQTLIGNSTGGTIHYGTALFSRPVYINAAGGGYGISIGGSGGDYGSIGYNVDYTATSGLYNYRVGDYASFIRFTAGGFQFFNAPSGSGVMSPTLRAILGNNGSLTIGASEGSLTGGDIYARYGRFGDYLFLNEKLALRGTDTYLRLNQNGEFADGIYTPYNLRTDGTTYFGGTTYYIGGTANLPITQVNGGLYVSSFIANTNSVGADNGFGLFFGTVAEGSDYVIRRRAGSWSAPYQPLDIKFYTGIRIGADYSYGGTIFYSSSNLATALFSVGYYDQNIRMHVGGQKFITYNTGSGIEVEALQTNYFGYSNSYAVLQIGDTRANRSIAFGVDLTGNPSGSFNGGGLEYIWKNVGRFITPNASNNGYNGLFSWSSTGAITMMNHLSTGGYNIDAGAGTIYATTFVGSLTEANSVNVRGSAGLGGISLIKGNASQTGYIEWWNGSAVRQAYMGYNNTNLTLVLEAGAEFQVTGTTRLQTLIASANSTINGTDRVLTLGGAGSGANSLLRYSDGSTAKWSTGFNGGNYIIYDDVNGAYRATISSTGATFNGHFNVNGGRTTLSYTQTTTSYTEAVAQIYSESGATYGPRVAFHWGGVVASQIGIQSSGRIAILDNPGTGYANFIAGYGEFTGDVVLTTGVNRYVQIGSSTNYYWRLKTNGDNFRINMGADALTALEFTYPNGAATFASSISATSGTFSSIVQSTNFYSTSNSGEVFRMMGTGSQDFWLQGGGTFRIVNTGYSQQLFTVNQSGDTYAYGTTTSEYGFIKSGYSNSYFLLAGGGTVPTSTYAVAANYLPLAGGTMLGGINMGTYNISNAANIYATSFIGTGAYMGTVYTDVVRNVAGEGMISYASNVNYIGGGAAAHSLAFYAGGVNRMQLSTGGSLVQNTTVVYPNAKWGASSGTGPVIIKIPGGSGNYGMIHMTIAIYEYNSNAASTITVGGHNWSSGWYNTSVNVEGYTNKQVRLGFKDGQYCVVIGDGSSTWSYGQVVVMRVQNGEYYSGSIDLGGTWSVALESDSYTTISGDLRTFKTSREIYLMDNVMKIGIDDTYGTAYNAIGFSGGGTTNAHNKIFAHSTSGAGLFINAASGQNVYLRSGGAEIAYGNAFNFYVAATTGSTSWGTGALTVAGGAGINGNLYTSGNIVSGSGIYSGSWFYASGITGLYNSTYAGYFYQASSNYWTMTSSNGMIFRSGYESTLKGYVYYDSTGFGLLNAAGQWAVRTNTSSDNQLYGIWGVNMAPSGTYTLEVGGTIRASGAITSNVGLVLNTGGVVPPITGNGGIRLVDSDNSNDVTLTLPSSTMLDIDSSVTAVHYSSNSFVSIAYGTGAGTFPTIGIEGNDVGMRIQVTIGTSPAASATIATITFGTAYTTFPSLVFSPGNANAAALTGAKSIYVDNGASPLSSFILVSGTTPLTETLTYVWYVHAIQADYPA